MAVRRVFTEDDTTDTIYGLGDGNVRVVVAGGTFGGGTLTLEVSPDNGQTFITDAGVSLSAEGVEDFNAPRDMPFRIKLAGSTNPNLNVAVY